MSTTVPRVSDVVTQNTGSWNALRGTSTDAAGVHGHGSDRRIWPRPAAVGSASTGEVQWHRAGGKGREQSATNGYAAVYGLTNGTGPAVYGEGTAQGNGTSGVARGTGSGVYGRSDDGRGGRFSGKKAQIKLDPATTATHPTTGDAGDIYLDKSKRLWLCKGGTSWVRLDL